MVSGGITKFGSVAIAMMDAVWDEIHSIPTKQIPSVTKPNRPIGDKRLKPNRRQTNCIGQTMEFDHVGHSKLRLPNLLPSLPGPNASAGLIPLGELSINAQVI
jgi:hypothetical protein